MSIEAKQAIPHKQLIDELMDSRIPKTEREHAAAREIERLRQAIAEAEKKDNGKLKVTLQDTPTEIELAQYKRMFESACSALGAIGDALGVDPEEGGAEPILAAIAELKLTSPPQRQWVGLTDKEVRQMCGSVPSMREAVREAEAILKEKNT